ncbi:unnamed protein product, partial [Tuber aestivum]
MTCMTYHKHTERVDDDRRVGELINNCIIFIDSGGFPPIIGFRLFGPVCNLCHNVLCLVAFTAQVLSSGIISSQRNQRPPPLTVLANFRRMPCRNILDTRSRSYGLLPSLACQLASRHMKPPPPINKKGRETPIRRHVDADGITFFFLFSVSLIG